MPARKSPRAPAPGRSTAAPPEGSPFSERRFSAWQALGFAAVILAVVGGACLAGVLVGFAFGRTTARPVVSLPGPSVGPVAPEGPSPIVPPGQTYLGVRYVVVTRELARREGLSVTDGALLRHIDAGGPADEAGLLRGDVITEVNGVVLSANQDLRFVISRYSPGDELTLAVARGDQFLTVRVTLGSNVEDD